MSRFYRSSRESGVDSSVRETWLLRRTPRGGDGYDFHSLLPCSTCCSQSPPRAIKLADSFDVPGFLVETKGHPLSRGKATHLSCETKRLYQQGGAPWHSRTSGFTCGSSLSRYGLRSCFSSSMQTISSCGSPGICKEC